MRPISDVEREILADREWNERCTLPSYRKWFVIEMWINLTWFRTTDEYPSADIARQQTKHYNMPMPLRIIECITAETEVMRFTNEC